MRTPPTKLKNDAIIEAIFEVRFDTSLIGELTPATLVRHDAWASFVVTRLPTADIPASLRNADPALATQPILELRNEDGSRVVKVGEQVFSLHILGTYPGWTAFKSELNIALNHLHSSLPDFKAKRFGLRYIDVFREDLHGVGDVSDLGILVEVGGQKLDPPYNLNYKRSGIEWEMVVKVAGKELFTSPVANASALVDIDVSTPEGFASDNLDFAGNWLDGAHTAMKTAFFSLFTEKMLAELTE